MNIIQHFRVARHTDDMDKIIYFYRDLLGLSIIGSFENHEGYNGTMLGDKNHTWHLEFTTSKELSNSKYNEEDLLVFYYENNHEYEEIINKLDKNNIKCVKSRNPYWERVGKTYLDPDGHRIVICNRKW